MSHKGEKRGISRRELFQGTLLAGLMPAGLIGKGALGEEPRPESGGRTLGPGPVRIALRINGSERSLEVEPRTTLLTALRDKLDLTGAKPTCERGECGACTVLLDGAPIMSCMLLALDAANREVTTVEGLAKGDALSPLQRAFVEHDALQCGFCTPGMLMSCTALLARDPHPTRDDVRRAIAGNLCRCGTYPKILDAVTSISGK